MKKLLLSIGMIVKNESKYLEKCLDALMPILRNVDSELVIVDTGSTDKTVEIAKKYTNNVFFYQWNNDFAEARNMTIEKSQGQWYFYIDADEILKNAKSIIDFFNKGIYKQYEAFAIKIENVSKDDQSKTGSTFYSKRIVKRDKDLKFTSRIHEHLPNKMPAYAADAVLIHFGYIQTDSRFVEEKAKRNIEIIKEELDKEPDSVFLLFHLAQTYIFNFNFMEALEPARKALEISRNSKTHPMHVYILMLDVCIKNGLFTEAEETANEALKAKYEETSAYISVYFYLAQAQAMLNKNIEAIESYKKCLKLLVRYEKNELMIDLNATVADFGGEKYVYSQIAAIYDVLLDYENSEKFTKKILNLTKNDTDHDYYFMAVSQIVKLSVKYKRYDNLVEYYKNVIHEKNEMQIVLIERFENTLESLISNNKNHRDEVINRFSGLEIDNDYVFLNKIRKSKATKQALSKEEVEQIRSYNFSDKIDIYCELVYYLMEEGLEIDSIFSKLEEKEINRYNEYLAKTFTDYSEVVTNYFKKYDDQKDILYSIFSKALKRVVLIKEEIDNASYLDLFKRYVAEGIFYLDNVYKTQILDTENTNVLKNNEEAFFIYMRKALKYKEIDQKEYLRYLRKALHAYEYMKKGIELLLEELKFEEEKQGASNSAANKEFEAYKVLVKNNIADLIKDQKIAEAKHLIDEYLSIVPDDLEMLTLKSEVQLRLM